MRNLRRMRRNNLPARESRGRARPTGRQVLRTIPYGLNNDLSPPYLRITRASEGGPILQKPDETAAKSAIRIPPERNPGREEPAGPQEERRLAAELQAKR